jgi:4-hydroxy-2-oxoheptanedioate aldolase
MRVADVCEADILRALDVGVHGIQVPNISDTKEINRIIHYAKYPPLGNRGYSPFTRAGGYSLENAKTLPEIANNNTMIGINVEGKEAIENIDSILSIEGLDIVFIGLFDLSKALGIPGRVNDKSVTDYLSQLTDKINESGKYPGTIATNIDQIKTYTAMGIKYLVYLVDCDMLRRAYADVSKIFKSVKNV